MPCLSITPPPAHTQPSAQFSVVLSQLLHSLQQYHSPQTKHPVRNCIAVLSGGGPSNTPYVELPPGVTACDHVKTVCDRVTTFAKLPVGDPVTLPKIYRYYVTYWYTVSHTHTMPASTVYEVTIPGRNSWYGAYWSDHPLSGNCQLLTCPMESDFSSTL